MRRPRSHLGLAAQMRQRSGMALIIVLLAVALLATLILSFFSRSILNQKIAYSSINQVRAEMLTRSALDLITGELKEEIRTGSTTLNGGDSSYSSIYQPLASLDLLPQKEGVSSPDTIGAATITKVSAANTSLNANNGRVLGSGVSTSTASVNGRYLSTDLWFGTRGPQLGTQGNLPNWVFLSRANSIVTTPSYSATISDPNYVLGRFAYTVYDVSGLLNANVAGYPSVDAADAVYKSSVAYADLSQIPGFSTTSAIDQFVGWRQGADASSASSYSTYLQNYGLNSGFLTTKVADNAFFSRHDLINLTQQGVSGLSTASLGYLTHFSCSVNAPSWVPTNSPAVDTTKFNYVSAAESAGSANRDVVNVRYSNSGTLTHFLDDGITKTTSVVTAGDPVVQRRFSLARMAWIQAKETTPTDTSHDAAIQAAFGLVWDASDDHWNYVGPSGSTTQGTIETLAQVAAESSVREPNFFELLKAGILSGSLGMTTEAGQSSLALAANSSVDTDSDLQIIRIGADAIACARTDNYPTIITLLYENEIPFEVASVADLPYLYGINANGFYTKTSPTADPQNGKLINADVVFVPVFINPHRPSDNMATAGPAQVVCDIVSGTLYGVNFGAGTYTEASVNPIIDLTALPKISIPSSQFESFRNGPQPVTQAGAANSLGVMMPYVDSDLSSILGFDFYSWERQAPAGVFPFLISSTNACFGISAANVTYRLQFQARDGTMKTYATFGGYEALPDTTGLQQGLGFGSSILYGPSQTAFQASYFITGTDPRTNRVGPGLGWTRPNVAASPTAVPLPLQSLAAPGASQLQDNIGQQLGFDMQGDTSYIGYWPQGPKNQILSTPYGPTVANSIDPDETQGKTLRPADGWLGSSANPYAQTTGETLNPTDQSRPVLLHRAYRSVAELGYVFRDTQWKSLSFFDETSADSALLDLFSVSDEAPVTADRVNLNTQQPAVLTALLNGCAQNSDGTNPLSSPSAIATAYNQYAFSSGTATSSMPVNLAGLANFMSSSPLAASGLDTIKYHREAVVRALGSGTQTRTWNLLIDLDAQAGRYPKSAQSVDDFLVEGEKHYWVSVAIDRFTNKIVQEQWEPANE